MRAPAHTLLQADPQTARMYPGRMGWVGRSTGCRPSEARASPPPRRRWARIPRWNRRAVRPATQPSEPWSTPRHPSGTDQRGCRPRRRWRRWPRSPTARSSVPAPPTRRRPQTGRSSRWRRSATDHRGRRRTPARSDRWWAAGASSTSPPTCRPRGRSGITARRRPRPEDARRAAARKRGRRRPRTAASTTMRRARHRRWSQGASFPRLRVASPRRSMSPCRRYSS